MRDYAKVSPQFWIGSTGKRLRQAGLDAQVVAMYLLTAPNSNMLGLFYLPLVVVAHETGLSTEGVSKGLRSCIEAQFCDYDEASEMVWVYEMASYQIGDQLAAGDKQCKGVQNAYDALPQNPFLTAFYARYRAAFHLTKARGIPPSTPPSDEAPPKPHRSQEQEQEQEQDQEHTDARANEPPEIVPREASQAPEVGIRIAGEPAPELSPQFAEWVIGIYPPCMGRRAFSTAFHTAAVIVGAGLATEEDLRRRLTGWVAYVAGGGVSGPERVTTPQNWFSMTLEDPPWAREWSAPRTRAEKRQDSTVDAGRRFLEASV
jgi:hypothetical protein